MIEQFKYRMPFCFESLLIASSFSSGFLVCSAWEVHLLPLPLRPGGAHASVSMVSELVEELPLDAATALYVQTVRTVRRRKRGASGGWTGRPTTWGLDGQ
ncbi:unnamed protein product [Durusdinium trenchii]|uniref:Secreted protein n=1 Tax=Durusdinium trenchii TaxID=1381693 RepID=A0ABP0QVB5_9DINO